jgi:hypothetical protein
MQVKNFGSQIVPVESTGQTRNFFEISIDYRYDLHNGIGFWWGGPALPGSKKESPSGAVVSGKIMTPSQGRGNMGPALWPAALLAAVQRTHPTARLFGTLIHEPLAHPKP